MITTVVDPDNASEVWSSPRILGLTVKLVAFVVLHVRVTIDPAATDDALAVKLTVGAAPELTLIVTVFVVFPPGPFAVAV